MPLPTIYIAAPLFNPAQIRIIEDIETTCDHFNIPYFSPRLHSGSHLLSPEDRKDPAKWEPVFKANEAALYRCDLLLACLGYPISPFPDYDSAALMLVQYNKHDLASTSPMHIVELPDNGVCWEMGYAKCLHTPIVGFHHEKPLKDMNLMLTHSISGFLSGAQFWHFAKALTESSIRCAIDTATQRFKGQSL